MCEACEHGKYVHIKCSEFHHQVILALRRSRVIKDKLFMTQLHFWKPRAPWTFWHVADCVCGSEAQCCDCSTYIMASSPLQQIPTALPFRRMNCHLLSQRPSKVLKEQGCSQFALSFTTTFVRLNFMVDRWASFQRNTSHIFAKCCTTTAVVTGAGYRVLKTTFDSQQKMCA